MVDLNLALLVAVLKAELDVSSWNWLSCWARLAMIVGSTSPLASSVFMDSFSEIDWNVLVLGCRIYWRQSRVFRANRLMDLVMIMSMFPAMHSSIMRLNSSRFWCWYQRCHRPQICLPAPVGILLDVLRVVRDLRLVACFLFFGIRADAAVST